MTTLPRPLHFTLRVLEKIGAPAVGAVLDTSARAAATDAAPTTREAEAIATLMRQSAEMALKLDALKDFDGTPEEADSFRLGLTAVSAKVISDLYRITGSPPAAAELTRAASCFETVRLFANQFVTANDAANRLAALGTDFVPLDSAQSTLSVFMALAPVVHAVATFSFGQDPQGLVRAQGDRILSRADAIIALHFAQSSDDERRMARLACVRALAQHYAQVHMMETGRMMATPAGSPAPDPATALAAVNTGFDARVQLLMALIAHAQGGGDASSSRPAENAPIAPVAKATQPSAATPLSHSAPPPAGAKPAIFSTNPTEVSPPADPTPDISAPEDRADTDAPPSTSTQSGESGGQGGNPMSFFVKK